MWSSANGSGMRSQRTPGRISRLVPGAGSAIFLHVARGGFLPTEGCVALRRADLVRLLRRVGPGTRMQIG